MFAPPKIATLRTRHVCAILLAFASLGARAQPFDWTLLNGQWAESVRNAYGCRPDNVHHRFEVSADHKHLVFALDRQWKIGTGQEVLRYSAAIVAESPTMLTIRYDPELTGIPASMRDWELLFIGPGTYRWRATFWREGQYNDVVGVKCAP